MEIFCEVVIVLTSFVSPWLLGLKDDRRKWGFVVSLCSQPFWILTSIAHKQWGVLIGAFWFGVCGVRGIRNHFTSHDGPNKN